MKINDAYQAMSEACGIKVGDTVRVIRKAESCEMGWCNSWSRNMDYSIGKEYKVCAVNHYRGFSLDVGDDRFEYPFFVLEKVIPAPILDDGWFTDVRPNFSDSFHGFVWCLSNHDQGSEKVKVLFKYYQDVKENQPWQKPIVQIPAVYK